MEVPLVLINLYVGRFEARGGDNSLGFLGFLQGSVVLRGTALSSP